MALGAEKLGYHVTIRGANSYTEPDADFAIFYGFDETLQRIFAEYRAAGRPVVYVDLGYWGRTEGGRYIGYHKVAVNGRHPGDYFMRPQRPDRFNALGVKIRPWQTTGQKIILAGASDRAAVINGYAPEQWEMETIAAIRAVSQREILYRPKPTWRGARPLPGSTFAPSTEDISIALKDAFAVVTRHSNVAVDALIAGVPSFCFDGVAKPLSSQDLSQIESPLRPDGREQWAANVAYCQWKVLEMSDGEPLSHLRNEGLIP